MTFIDYEGWQPPHLSFSTIDGYRFCGMRLKLQKVLRLSGPPSLAAFGGNVLHTATEEWDRQHAQGYNLDARDLVLEAWAQTEREYGERDPEYGLVDYIVTGRAPAAYGGKRTIEWWHDNLPGMVQKWIDWRLGAAWTIPVIDNALGIELELTPVLPNGIPIKMHIDRLFFTPAAVPSVLDLKSGRTPETAEQLGLYAWGCEVQTGVRPQYGFFWSPDKGLSEPYDLSRYTQEYFTEVADQMVAGANAGCFLAKPQNNCKSWCSMAAHCPAVGGRLPKTLSHS